MSRLAVVDSSGDDPTLIGELTVRDNTVSGELDDQQAQAIADKFDNYEVISGAEPPPDVEHRDVVAAEGYDPASEERTTEDLQRELQRAGFLVGHPAELKNELDV